MNITEARISIKGPSDLLTTVPLLLGFRPEHSLVVVGLLDGEFQCTFRVDLPGSADHLEHLVDLTGQLSMNDCNGCIVIGYGDKEVAEGSIDRAAERFRAAGIIPVDRLRVAEGRWFSLTCTGPCCPPEGTPIPETTPASCEVAVAGAYAAADRAEIAERLAPAPPGRRAAVERAVAVMLEKEADLDWGTQRSQDLHTIDHWLGADTLPDTGDIAAIGLALGDLDIRDYALRRICSGAYDGNRADLWVWVARHMPDDLVAPAASVAGFAAYRFGNGVLAREAFDMAIAASPNYRLAQVLAAALQAGIPPGALSRIGSADLEAAAED